MNHKDQWVILRLCKGVIHIFDVLFHEKTSTDDLINVFQSIKSTIKVLFKLSKEKKYDKMFIEENLVPDLLRIVNDYYIEGEKKMTSLTSKKINKDGTSIEIHN